MVIWLSFVWSFGNVLLGDLEQINSTEYAHKDIAFEFAMWISPEFKVYLIREFQRLKDEEQKQLGWTAKRELSKINYRIHTDAIKQNLIPEEVTAAQASIIYAEEADVLNVAMFELMLAFRRGLRLVPARTLGANTRGFSNMVETKRNYEIVEGRPELQVELTCTNPECGNVWIRRFPTE